MKINKIVETAIYCDDVQGMLDFYKALPGIEVVAEYLPRLVFLKCGESLLAIFNRSMSSQDGQVAPHHGVNGAQHFAFEVPNSEYEDWKKLIAEKCGIEKEIAWESRTNGARSFYFRDPAGNNVEIAEEKLWDPAGYTS